MALIWAFDYGVFLVENSLSWIDFIKWNHYQVHSPLSVAWATLTYINMNEALMLSLIAESTHTIEYPLFGDNFIDLAWIWRLKIRTDIWKHLMCCCLPSDHSMLILTKALFIRTVSECIATRRASSPSRTFCHSEWFE